LFAAGVVPQIERGEGKATALPQWLADRFGWEEFVTDVEVAARELTPEQRASAVIVAPSYGHAGALELFGSSDLPPILATQNTYWLWGFDVLAEHDPQGGLAITWEPEPLRDIYDRVELVGEHRCEYCMPWRSELPIYRVWGSRVPLADIWPQLKHFE
jgi:hypothetical protein